QFGRAVDEVIGAADGKQGVVLLSPGRVPERDDLVAAIFVDGPVPGKDDAAQVVEIHPNHAHDLVGLHTLGDRGKAADIHEKQSDVSALAATKDVVDAAARLGQLRHDLGLQVVA